MSRNTSRSRRAPRTGPSFIDTLADLHALDPDEIGLGSFGKWDSYVGRQLHRWYASWNASKDREILDVDRLHGFLVERLPEQTTVSPCTVTTGSTTVGLLPMATSPRSSTGRSRHSAIRWPIWRIASTRSEPGDVPAGGSVPPTACRASVVARSSSTAMRAHERRPRPDRVLPLLQLLEDRLHPARRVCPVRPRSEGHRGCRHERLPPPDDAEPRAGRGGGRPPVTPSSGGAVPCTTEQRVLGKARCGTPAATSSWRWTSSTGSCCTAGSTTPVRSSTVAAPRRRDGRRSRADRWRRRLARRRRPQLRPPLPRRCRASARRSDTGRDALNDGACDPQGRFWAARWLRTTVRVPERCSVSTATATSSRCSMR